MADSSIKLLLTNLLSLSLDKALLAGDYGLQHVTSGVEGSVVPGVGNSAVELKADESFVLEQAPASKEAAHNSSRLLHTSLRWRFASCFSCSPSS